MVLLFLLLVTPAWLSNRTLINIHDEYSTVTSMEVTIEKFNPWRDSLFTGIFMVIIGIIMMVLGDDALKWILILAGILCLVSGVFMIYGAMSSKFTPSLVMGAILFVLGIALVIMTNVFEDILMIILALGLIVMGIVSLFGINSGFAVARGSKIVSVVIGILLIIVGGYALLNLDDTATAVMIIIGAIITVSGLLELFEAYELKRISA